MNLKQAMTYVRKTGDQYTFSCPEGSLGRCLATFSEKTPLISALRGIKHLEAF